MAVRELWRRPGRFAPVGGALVLLVLLLLVLGGFLDGLTLSQTGSYRAQAGHLLVLSADADLQLDRSRLPTSAAQRLTDQEGVAAVGGLATVPTTAGTGQQVEDVVLIGYGLDTTVLPAPPTDGEVVVDRQLARVADVAVGDVVAIGPEGHELTVSAFVDDVSQGAPTLWTSLPTWREVASSAAAAGSLPADAVEAFVVAPTAGTGLSTLASTIEDGGRVQAATVDELVGALDVVQQQAATFRGIIAVTLVVTFLVVALFFALLTLERVRVHAVLKAMGARTLDLVAGVAAQAVVVAAVAVLLGGGLAVAFTAVLPPDLPVRLVPGRGLVVAAGTLVTALAGGLVTLRRLLRIDPAQALG